MAQRMQTYTRTKVFNGISVDEVVSSATQWINKNIDNYGKKAFINMAVTDSSDSTALTGKCHIANAVVIYSEAVWVNCGDDQE